MDKSWIQELKESPTSMVLLALSAYLVYQIGCDLFRKDEPPPKPLEPLKQDMTLKEVFSIEQTGAFTKYDLAEEIQRPRCVR